MVPETPSKVGQHGRTYPTRHGIQFEHHFGINQRITSFLQPAKVRNAQKNSFI